MVQPFFELLKYINKMKGGDILKATKIKMKTGKYYSQNLAEIDEIYISDCKEPGFYKKAVLYDHLQVYPNSINVNIYPYPSLIPAISINGEKFVRSTPNNYTHDNLLDLPRV